MSEDKTTKGWMALGPSLSGDAPEVYPIDDRMPHQVGSEGCPCRPFWCDGILVHQAFDNRTEMEYPHVH